MLENMETLQFQENVSSSDDDCDILSSEIHGLELYECEAYSTLDVDSSLDMMMQFLEC